jgi:hypothetical protein
MASLPFAAPEKPKPAKSGIRDLTAVKEALNASSDTDKKPAVRETNGAVQTTNAAETTAANAGKAVIPETDRNATGGGEQSQDKEGGGKEKTEDHDLDAYLMGGLDDDGGSSDRLHFQRHRFYIIFFYHLRPCRCKMVGFATSLSRSLSVVCF